MENLITTTRKRWQFLGTRFRVRKVFSSTARRQSLLSQAAVCFRSSEELECCICLQSGIRLFSKIKDKIKYSEVKRSSFARVVAQSSWLCEAVIIRLRCSHFSDDVLYIIGLQRLHRAPCKNYKKNPRAFVFERIGVIFGTPVGRTICSKYDLRFFFRTTP